MGIDISWTHDNKTVLDREFSFKKLSRKQVKSLSITAPFLLEALELTQEFIAPEVEEIVKSPTLMENLATIAEFCATVGKFIKDCIWCLANPVHALLILLEKMTPLMVCFASIVPIIALISMLFGSKKIWKWNTKDLVVNPLIALFIYLVLIGILREVV